MGIENLSGGRISSCQFVKGDAREEERINSRGRTWPLKVLQSFNL